MTTFVQDTFSGATGGDLSGHTGETGATWTRHPSSANSWLIGSANDAYPSGGTSYYYASGTPGSAEYDVSADFHLVTNRADTSACGVLGRMDTSAVTHYRLALSEQATPNWVLHKFVAGAATQLATTTTGVPNTGDTVTTTLQMRSSGTLLNVNAGANTGVITSNDSAITAAGKAGVRSFNGATNTTGVHLDNFLAADTGGGGGAPAVVPQRMLVGVGV